MKTIIVGLLLLLATQAIQAAQYPWGSPEAEKARVEAIEKENVNHKELQQKHLDALEKVRQEKLQERRHREVIDTLRSLQR